ncbi:MAG: class I SAM-dependent methyltransferase, partial [Nitrososphaeraceae archaeon]
FIYVNLHLLKGSKILEAGCGTGRILLPLAKKGYKCYGIDPSTEMLSVFKNKDNCRSDIKYIGGDIESLPFYDNIFDGVYTLNVLQWLPSGYEKAFLEMYRVVKKNGRIIMDFPNRNSLWRIIKRFFRLRKDVIKSYCYYELTSAFNLSTHVDIVIKGYFSYPQKFLKYQIIRHIIIFFETIFPLPFKLRSKYYVIITK